MTQKLWIFIALLMVKEILYLETCIFIVHVWDWALFYQFKDQF